MKASTLKLTIMLSFSFAALVFGCGAPTITDLNGDPGGTPRGTPGPTATPLPGHHHPPGYGLPAAHGLYAKFAAENCTSCHGSNLDAVGGATGAVSCDGACHESDTSSQTPHAANWRTDCTFCHGGADNASGAPGRDITELKGETTANLIFTKHTLHVTAGARHPAYDCVECHFKPANALSSGHWLVGDTTPGVAEVGCTLSGGTCSVITPSLISPTMIYGASGSGKCTNVYCHGNGNGPNGTVLQTDPTPNCNTGCHPNQGSPGTWGNLDGAHGKHLNSAQGGGGIKCFDCHSQTVDTNNNIIAPLKHADGNAIVGGVSKTVTELGFGGGTVTYANGKCNGTCHGKGHGGLGW